MSTNNNNNTTSDQPKTEEYQFQSLDEKKQFLIFKKRVKTMPEYHGEHMCDPDSPRDLVRYLRAKNHDIEAAFQYWKETMEWRQTSRPWEITASDWPSEANSGKFLLLPAHDRSGHRVAVFFPALHDPNKRDMEQSKKYILYTIEQALITAPPNTDPKLTIIWDRTNFTRQNFDLPLVRECYKFLVYYPEMCHKVLIIHIDMLFWALYQVVKVFFDDNLKKKIEICSDNAFSAQKKFLLTVISEDNLWDLYGGKLAYSPPVDSEPLSNLLSQITSKNLK